MWQALEPAGRAKTAVFTRPKSRNILSGSALALFCRVPLSIGNSRLLSSSRDWFDMLCKSDERRRQLSGETGFELEVSEAQSWASRGRKSLRVA